MNIYDLSLNVSRYLASSKRFSVRRLIQPGYDDDYRSKSHRFVERQKRTSTGDGQWTSADKSEWRAGAVAYRVAYLARSRDA